MHSFLRLILEGFPGAKNKPPKPHASMIKKVAKGSNWRSMGVKKKYKKLIPKKSALLSGRTLINQTNKTRKVWDPKGYQAQKFNDGIYRKI